MKLIQKQQWNIEEEKKIILNNKPSFLLGWMRKRIYNQNGNVLGYFDGRQGTGKSYSCLALCEAMDFTFSVKRVCFSVQEVFEIMENIPKGAFVMLEEAGVAVHNLSFWSPENKSFNALLQTFRDKNLGLLMTAPNNRMIDSQTKSLMYLHFTCMPFGMNRDKGINKVRLVQIIPVPNRKDPLEPYFTRWNTKTHSVEQLRYITIHKPTDFLIGQYEMKRKAYRNSLDKKMLAKLRAVQIKE